MRQRFGLADAPVRLPGGQGGSWKVGPAVLKRAPGREEADWVAETLGALVEDGFRVPRPVPAQDGSWVVAGWTAWTWVEGEHPSTHRWDEVLAVGRRFHAALADRPRPAFLDARDDPWSHGDRAAWGESDLVVGQAFGPLVKRFASVLRPVALPSQVVHGDLGENVLFANDRPPAVIDFAPYFRPAGFALGVVVVDAIAWRGAPLALADEVDEVDDQLVARAAIYRLVTADRLLVGPDRRARADREVAAHAPLAALVGA